MFCPGQKDHHFELQKHGDNPSARISHIFCLLKLISQANLHDCPLQLPKFTAERLLNPVELQLPESHQGKTCHSPWQYIPVVLSLTFTLMS